MPSFAELKEKAVKAKDASADKMRQVKSNNTSVSMKKTNWDPYSGAPPPPLPPPRVNSRSKPTKAERPPLPPPPRRTDTITSSSSSSSSRPAAISRRLSSTTSNKSPPPPLPGRSALPPRLPPRTPSTIASPSPRVSSAPVPPPLPSRQPSGSSRSPSAAPPPPPISRSTRPNLPSATATPPAPNLSPPPPPPPQRSFSPAQPKIIPPSFSRVQSHQQTRDSDNTEIDWTSLSQQDKQAFFLWLDEYFSRSLNISLSS